MGKSERATNGCVDVLEQDDLDEDVQCGFWIFKGPGLQKFATKKCYMLVYSLVAVLQSMFFTYFIAVLTTVEKEFKLPSQTTGILLSGNEVSQICLSLVLTYFGGHGHRPRLVAIGMLFSAFASFIVTVPHFLYGAETPLFNAKRNYDLCEPTDNTTTNCTDYQEPSIGPMIFLFLSQFISGIGSTLFYTLGITYLDDNTKQKNTPNTMGIMSSLRLLGPALGFGLGALCLRFYVNVSTWVPFGPRHPSWVGAWWIGFLIIGGCLLPSALLLALFPRRLPKTKVKPLLKTQHSTSGVSNVSSDRPTMKDFPKALKRLLCNKALMFNHLSGVFYVFAFSGYVTFLPKYMEVHFHQSAALANAFNGSTGILFMATGFLLSGYLIGKFRPPAWLLAGWDVFIGMTYVGGLILFAYVGCAGQPIHGISKDSNDEQVASIITSCNKHCNCLPNYYSPVCSEDNLMNFFSPCHAGCSAFKIAPDGNKLYEDCSCIVQHTSNSSDATVWEHGGTYSGYCPSDCFTVFLFYVGAMGIMKLLSSTGRVGSILIGFRCVAPEDKSFAIGLGTLLISLFAFIPSPIVYGAIIDKACLIWQNECGHDGNCLLYDTEKIRLYLHYTTAGFVALGVFFDAFVCYYVRDLDLYGGDEEDDFPGSSQNGKKTASSPDEKSTISVFNRPEEQAFMASNASLNRI